MIRVIFARELRQLRQEREEYRVHAFGETKRREQVEADRTLLWDRIRELEQVVVNMKKEGFEPAPQAPDVPETMIHSTVLETLDEIAPRGTPYRQQEFSLALAELEAGVEPGEVARRMREGGKVNIFASGRLREDNDG